MPIDFARTVCGLALALSSSFVLGACAEPLQNGGVVVFSGASARFDAMCRFRRGAEGKQSSCAPASGDVAHATAMRIEKESQLLKGPQAEGAVGDILLTNGEVSFVFAANGGALLDVVDAHVGLDELGSLTPCIVEEDHCMALSTPEFGQERDGSAWVEVHLAEPKPFDVRTRYTLLPGARSLLLTTIGSSPSPEPVGFSRMGDAVKGGLAKSNIPAVEAPPFAAFVGTDVAYGLVPVDDRTNIGAVEPLGAATFLRYAQSAVIAPDRVLRRDRALVVAPRGDTLGVLTEVAFMREGKGPGAIEMRFVGPDGSPVAPPAGGYVRFLNSSFPIEPLLAIGSAPEGPTVAAEAPPGKYELDFESIGRRAVTKVPVEVRSGEVTQVTMTIVANPPETPQ